MANPALAPGALQKSQGKSRVDQKREAKAITDTAWRSLCRYVDGRDNGLCRACGRRCDPTAINMLRRGEHHHLIYRSAGGEDTKENVLLLCLGCHQDEHAHRMRLSGNAETGIEVWRLDRDGNEYLAMREIAPGVCERD